MTSDEEDRLVTQIEAADELGVSDRMIRKLIAAGLVAHEEEEYRHWRGRATRKYRLGDVRTALDQWRGGHRRA